MSRAFFLFVAIGLTFCAGLWWYGWWSYNDSRNPRPIAGDDLGTVITTNPPSYIPPKPSK